MKKEKKNGGNHKSAKMKRKYTVIQQFFIQVIMFKVKYIITLPLLLGLVNDNTLLAS